MKKIAVIGAGSWGCALAMQLARHNDNVHLWDIDTPLLDELEKKRENTRYLPGIALPQALQITKDFDQLIDGTAWILVVVPSHVFSKVLQSLAPKLSTQTPVVWASKGLDPETHDLLSHCAEKILGSRPMAVIAGPSFAKEVAAAKPTVIDAVANDSSLLATLQQCFNHGGFRLNPQNDFITVQLGGAMKNIVAIAVGMAEGLGFGTNAQCALMTIGLNDIYRLTKTLGGKPENLMSFSGLGDLILTCSDNQSRNRRFGLALGRGQTREAALKEINQIVEGLDNLSLALKLAQKQQTQLPIAHWLNETLTGKCSAKAAIEKMLQTPVILD